MCQIIPYKTVCCGRQYTRVERLPTCPEDWPRSKCTSHECIRLGYEDDQTVLKGPCFRCRGENVSSATGQIPAPTLAAGERLPISWKISGAFLPISGGLSLKPISGGYQLVEKERDNSALPQKKRRGRPRRIAKRESEDPDYEERSSKVPRIKGEKSIGQTPAPVANMIPTSGSEHHFAQPSSDMGYLPGNNPWPLSGMEGGNQSLAAYAAHFGNGYGPWQSGDGGNGMNLNYDYMDGLPRDSDGGNEEKGSLDPMLQKSQDNGLSNLIDPTLSNMGQAPQPTLEGNIGNQLQQTFFQNPQNNISNPNEELSPKPKGKPRQKKAKGKAPQDPLLQIPQEHGDSNINPETPPKLRIEKGRIHQKHIKKTAAIPDEIDEDDDKILPLNEQTCHIPFVDYNSVGGGSDDVKEGKIVVGGRVV